MSLKFESKKLITVIILALLMMILPTVGASPVFTGDVPTDFAVTNAVTITDQGFIDVGVPDAAPSGTISGNDMENLSIFYDATTDILYVGINTYTIAGDVDNDGDGGTTSVWLSILGGVDIADFGGTESFSLLLDIDEDGTFDVIAGVSGSTDTAGFSVNVFTGTPYAPAFAYGTPLLSHTGSLFGSPDATAPDVEFTILNFSTLPISSGIDPDSLSFGVNAFVGSFSDDGIGEDYIHGANQTIPVKLVSIGDKVWNDLNENGVHDAGEPGLENIVVTLYDCDDVLVATTDTDSEGLYSFTVAPGDYYVNFTLADGMVFSPMNAGTDDAVDSDADTVTGNTVCTTLAPGETNETLDAGMYVPEAVIGDKVWNDLNKNGVHDAGEPGLENIVVTLYDCDDVLVATTDTDSEGLYSFT
ncbi:MAG TPA: SdrD B-like domain-containing protein, partial [Candidatus Nanoarchaeia archaeon]|nr:SdrD B-like domain-containing protein [Candidatus Nanoarchaeia archaeon]